VTVDTSAVITELEPLANIALAKGCFLRHEALAFGFDDRWLSRGVKRGVLVRLRQGCYVPAEIWQATATTEQLVIRTQAVMRVAEGPVAGSHHSSCAMHEIDLWGVDTGRAHVVRLDGGAGRVDADATHHEGLCTDQDLVVVRGLRATRPGRAVLESASLSGVERGLVTADSALRLKLTSSDDLRRQQQLMLRWPNAQALRLVATLADGRSGSVGESRSRYMMWAHGLPMPTLQYKVRDGGTLVGICDFCWPELGLLGEFDGRVKYGRLLKPDQEPGDAVFDEKVREDLLREITGFGMVRWTWPELAAPRVTCERIRRAMRRSAAVRRRLSA